MDEADPGGNDYGVEAVGRSLRMGDHEAAFDAILYERDAAARKRMRVRMRSQDRTLGGSIWRLRTMRGVRRGEFGALDEKTIARIERGEARRPRCATLDAIASRLGVTVDEIETF